mmetsp:Transcript_1347/g.3373  ORF Transcript_1347/g.3373 Transcript_1347/m.3373 type:complete len:351 (+) Transcript_1347:318-1370(+)
MKLLFHSLRKSVSRIHNLLQHPSVGALHVSKECILERRHMLHIDPVTVSLDTNEEAGHNLLRLVGHVLSLLEELVEADSTIELLLRGGVKVRTELGEGGDLTVLGKLELHGTSDGLGGLVLGRGSDTGYGESHGDGRTLSLVEQLALQEDLSVRDGDHVGGDVGGHVTGLGLNDGERGEGPAPEVGVHLSSALQQTGVEVEHISGVGLTAGGATEEQRHLTVGHSLLGKIIVEDNGVLAVVTEVLAHGGASVGRKELEGSGVGGRSRDDDAVVHGPLLIQLSDELGDGGSLLSHADVNAGKGVLLGLLVDDGVDGDGGLSRLTIPDDQLTLTTSNGDEGVNGLEAREHGL